MPALTFHENCATAEPPGVNLPAANGELVTVAELYEQYARRLVERVRCSMPTTLCGRTDPEDVVQSVFRRFIVHYSRGGYSVPADQELWLLLVTIAMNKIRDEHSYLKANCRDVRRTRSIGPLDAGETMEAAQEVPLRMVIDELLAPLSADRRSMVELRLAGHEVKEIATAVGRSKRTVERYLQQFRDRLDFALTQTTS